AVRSARNRSSRRGIGLASPAAVLASAARPRIGLPSSPCASSRSMAPAVGRVSRVDGARRNRGQSPRATRMAGPSIELVLGPARGLGAGALADAALVGAAEGAGDGPARARPYSHLDPGGDPNSLRDQGWGVIAPLGPEGDRLLALARPLLDRRAAEQDGEVAV